jgi:acyl carrier protein
MELRDKLNQIFREVFGDDGINITPGMTANDVAGWDSFSHMTLIAAIEAQFKITFTQKEAMSFKCIGDLIECTERKVPV